MCNRAIQVVYFFLTKHCAFQEICLFHQTYSTYWLKLTDLRVSITSLILNTYRILYPLVVLVIKNQPANLGVTRDTGLIPGWGRSLRGGHGNPLQYFYLENVMDQKSLVGYSWQDHKESDTTKATWHIQLSIVSVWYPLLLC